MDSEISIEKINEKGVDNHVEMKDNIPLLMRKVTV